MMWFYCNFKLFNALIAVEVQFFNTLPTSVSKLQTISHVDFSIQFNEAIGIF